MTAFTEAKTGYCYVWDATGRINILHRMGDELLEALQLIATGEYQLQQLLDYTAVDLTSGGVDEAMRGRDEFNFSVNIQFGEGTVDEVRQRLTELSREQYQRSN